MSTGAPSNGKSTHLHFEDQHAERKGAPAAAAHKVHAADSSSPLHSQDGSGVLRMDAMAVNNVPKGDGVAHEDDDDHAKDQVHGPPAPVADTEKGSSTKSIILLALIFLSALVVMALVYRAFPKLDEEEYQFIKLPRNLEDAKNLARVLSRYKEKYFYQVLFSFFMTYIFLQTFAIPGSIFLSIISGFLYPFKLALPLVCLCSGIGASLCYLLSDLVLYRLFRKFFRKRIDSWREQVDRHRDNLLNYILFLRITPFLPNWFINVVSPIVSVSLRSFFIGTVLGVGPPSFVMIQAGTTLHKLTSYGEPFTWGYFGLLAVFAVLSLLPVLFRERLRKKLE